MSQEMNEQLSDLAKKFEGAKCPHCSQEIGVGLVAQVMAQSRMSFVITTREGELCQAETIGGTLTNLSKLLKAVGAEMGVKTQVLVEGVESSADTIRFNLLIARTERGIKKQTSEAKP